MKKVLLFTIVLFLLQTGFAQKVNVSDYPQGVSFGTKILMADGTQKNIEDLKEGDTVKTYSIDSLNFSSCKVKKLILAGGSLIKLTFSNNKWIFCTDNQPLFTIQSTGENVHIGEQVIISDTQKIWIAQGNSGNEKAVKKLQVKDIIYFTHDATSIQSVNLQKIDFLPTLSARRIYTLELENGNGFIANGFILKTK